MSAREIDINGFMSIQGNPIIREGVFPYLGSSIDPAGNDPDVEPDKIYYVYRPADEINNSETIESMKELPFVDEHAMLGPSDDGYVPAERKGIHGITGSSFDFKDGVLYSNLKIFSETLANLIKTGKRELSLGYRCRFVKQAGNFAGQAYDFIQRSLRGNHLALVDKGRNNVSVLDKSIVFDHFDVNFEKDKEMPTIEELASQVIALDEAVKALTEENKKLKLTMDEKDKEEEKAEDEDDKEKDKDAEDESDEDEKEAEDEGDGQGMPSEKEVEMKNSALDSAIKELKNEINSLKKSGIKSLVSEVSKRNVLANQISQHVGTFDHEDKTLDEVAQYGVEKLGLKCPKGHEQTALDAFFHSRQVSQPGYAMDSQQKSSSIVDAYLNKKG